eukprot:scaffold2642_cov120-Cylindrotheca_fusiformis.AAC.3
MNVSSGADRRQANETSLLLGSTTDTSPDDRNPSIYSMQHVPIVLSFGPDASTTTTTTGDHGELPADATAVHDDGQVMMGTANRMETVLNISKTCLGTGIIALPYAASQVEWWIHITGLLMIALWSLLCVQRLLSCLDLVHLIRENKRKQVVNVPNECSGLGEVAFFAFGKVGYHAMDLIFFSLLFLIIVSYLDAALGFLQNTFFVTATNRFWNVLPLAIIIGCLSFGDKMDSLSKVSAFGIGLILLVFAILIFGYGGGGGNNDDDLDGIFSNWPTQNATSMANFAQWYGTAVFGYGLVPLTYNFRASMEHKHDMLLASAIGLTGTSVLYIVLSVAIVLVFFPSGLQGDVLQLLPNDNSFLPTVVRLAMVGLVLTTAPLLVLPCGELIQQTVLPSHWSPAWIRTAICITAALLTVYLPEFVFVLAFVGSCWCILSFVIPPLFHLSLLQQVQQLYNDNKEGDGGTTTIVRAEQSESWMLDIILILIGSASTVASFIYTLRNLIDSA